MFSDRTVEREIYICPEVDSEDYILFPLLDDIEMMNMENEHYLNLDTVHVFPYVSCTCDGVPYVEVYIWDCMLYPADFKRYVICQGMRLPEKDEREFLYYINETLKNTFADISDSRMKKLYVDIRNNFPTWHYKLYFSHQISEALAHLYFTSHRSGVREILFKAGLDNIANSIEAVPGYNMIGSKPTEIIKLPMRLLRILNQPSLVHMLFDEESIEICRETYAEFSDYIGKTVSPAQWSYLEQLYMNKGKFFGRGFNRTMFNKLEDMFGDEIVYTYGRYFELLDKIPELKLRCPNVDDIDETLVKLETIYDYKISNYKENSLINKRFIKETDKYEYSRVGENYYIKMPRDGFELCKEAIKQGNCLLSYIRDHAESNSTILFLRHTDSPNKSFVTIEVFDKKIRQVYAAYNTLPTKDVYKFLERYARDKGFIYDPGVLIACFCDENEDYILDDELKTYLSDYEERAHWKPFPCDDIEYHQLSIMDCYTDIFKGVTNCA